MSSIKKLASETVWYGASSIFAKFLNYLLTPYLTHKFKGTPEYGQMSLVYAAISFVNIGVLFGLDYAYFRFIQRKETQKDLYPTLLLSLISSTALITVLIILFRIPIAQYIDVVNHPEYIILSALLIGFDALSALPFAKLRHEGPAPEICFYPGFGYPCEYRADLLFSVGLSALAESASQQHYRVIYQPSFGVCGVCAAGQCAAESFSARVAVAFFEGDSLEL